MAYETPLTIAEVMQDISTNKYVLPSIQREYVWDTDQIETLFDSLMQDYPIGAFLFWEIDKSRLLDYDFYEFLRNYHEKTDTHNKKVDLKGSDGVTAVLDGQQRLTYIYIGLKGSYAYRLKYKQKKNDNAYPTRYGCKHRNMTRGHKCDYLKQVSETKLDGTDMRQTADN